MITFCAGNDKGHERGVELLQEGDPDLAVGEGDAGGRAQPEGGRHQEIAGQRGAEVDLSWRPYRAEEEMKKSY